MNYFERTDEFEDWFKNLKDQIAKARILTRIDSASLGNFGECDSVGCGVSEMKIHFGPGYRVYFTRIDKVVYLLLAGGNKANQSKDIKHAIEIASNLTKGTKHEN
jgi:putative addiction module killer protein